MSARRYSPLLGALALSACASILGLPDEYSSGSGPAGSDAATSDQASGPDVDDGSSPDGSDDVDAAMLDARDDVAVDGSPDALGDADADAEPVTGPAILGLGAGWGHACAVVLTDAQERQLRCWGDCDSHQMGGSCTTSLASTPLAIEANAGHGLLKDVVAVAGGAASTCAVVGPAGKVMCVGSCEYGQVGNSTACPNTAGGNGSVAEYPVEVLDESSAPLTNIRAIAGFGQHYCALNQTNEVYCWGPDEWGGTLDPSAWRPQATLQAGLDGFAIGQIALGTRHTCVTADSGVLCWGANHEGELGYEGDASSLPTAVTVFGDAFDVSGSNEHSCAAVGTDGHVMCWGQWRDYGNLGPSGVQVDGGVLQDVRKIAGAYHFTCGLDSLGHVWCWGLNPERWAGRYATDAIPDYEPPFMIETATGTPLAGMKFLAGGSNFACAASYEHAYCWGDLAYSTAGLVCDPDAGDPSKCAVFAREITDLL